MKCCSFIRFLLEDVKNKENENLDNKDDCVKEVFKKMK